MDSKNEEELPQEMVDKERDAQMLASENLILDPAKHVEMAQEQWNYVNAKKAEAVASKDNLNRDCVYSFTADYYQNLYVPNFAGEQPGETYYYSL
eukprot:7813653-Ditylum_brightwellii.AAC.1